MHLPRSAVDQRTDGREATTVDAMAVEEVGEVVGGVAMIEEEEKRTWDAVNGGTVGINAHRDTQKTN